MIDADLLARSGWSAADFVANRDGRLSPLQTTLIRHRMRVYLRHMVLLVVPLPLIALIGAIVGLVVQGEPGYFVIPAMFIAIFSLVPIFVLPRLTAVHADLKDGRVAEVSGPIVRMFVNTATGQSRVRIGAVPMECFGPLWDRTWREGMHYLIEAHQAGTTLRAYYLPGSRLFVTAETVRAPL